MIKRASVLVGTLVLTLLLSACARGPARTDNDTHRETLAQNEKKPVSTAVVHNGQGNPRRVLIAYFTYPDNTDAQAIHSKEYDVMTSASLNVKDGEIIGNDAMIANEIARETGGDVFSILAEKPYSADYDAMIRDEKAAAARDEQRELKSHVGDMSRYDTVVLVYPIWWDALPAPVTSFLTENDFSGKALYAVASCPGTVILSIPSKTLPHSSPTRTSMKASSSVMTRWAKRPMPFGSGLGRRIS